MYVSAALAESGPFLSRFTSIVQFPADQRFYRPIIMFKSVERTVRHMADRSDTFERVNREIVARQK